MSEEKDDDEIKEQKLIGLPELARQVGGLSEEQTALIAEMAQAGFRPADMAAALGLPADSAYLFRVLANYQGSDISRHIAQAKAVGRLMAAADLTWLARRGNLEACKQLAEIQGDNEMRNLLANMDDDEYE